jgi:hypothetical protein
MSFGRHRAFRPVEQHAFVLDRQTAERSGSLRERFHPCRPAPARDARRSASISLAMLSGVMTGSRDVAAVRALTARAGSGRAKHCEAATVLDHANLSGTSSWTKNAALGCVKIRANFSAPPRGSGGNDVASRTDSTIWSGLFRISPTRARPLQAQIRQAIVAAILDRQIAGVHAAPLCRVLADRLGVARGTVVLAFQQLVDQGFLIARERRGHYRQSRSAGGSVRAVAGAGLPSRKIDWKARRRLAPSELPPPIKQFNWIKSSYPSSMGSSTPRSFPRPNGASATAWRGPCSKSGNGRPTRRIATTRS